MYKSSNILLEDNGHQPLKCSRGITVSLLHSMAHECAINGGKSCLPHVEQFNAYLFIRVGHINLRSIFTSSNIISDLLLIRKGGHILFCVLISFSAIYDSTKFGSAFLKDAEHRGGLRHIGLFPPSSTFIVLDFIDQLCLECIRTPRQVVIILLLLVDDRNLMIHLLKWWKMVWGTQQDVFIQFHPILSKVGELLLVLH